MRRIAISMAVAIVAVAVVASPAFADDAIGGGVPEAAESSNPHIIGTLPIPIPEPNEGLLYYNPHLAGTISVLPLPPPNEVVVYYNPNLTGTLPTPLP
jgi:hypothetical protein